MAERPILFSAPLVRALLDGTKTQTRRPVKLLRLDPDAPHPDILTCSTLWEARGGRLGCSFGSTEVGGDPVNETIAEAVCPYGTIGDVLWVREPARCLGTLPHAREMEVRYLADNASAVVSWPHRIKRPKAGHGLANGCYKEAARIWLRVTDVRVERVQDITEADARAEGVGKACARDIDPASGRQGAYTYYRGFRVVWDGIYAGRKDKPGLDWMSNPWAWVVEFDVLSTTGRPEGLEVPHG